MRCPHCHHEPRSENTITRLLRIIDRLLRCARPAQRGGILIFGQGKIEMTDILLIQGKAKLATLLLTDADGVHHDLPAGIVPVWSVSDNNLLTLAPAPDGLTCVVTAGTVDGLATLTTVTTYADGDVDRVSASVTVVDAEDTTGDISFSDVPVEAPPPVEVVPPAADSGTAGQPAA